MGEAASLHDLERYCMANNFKNVFPSWKVQKLYKFSDAGLGGACVYCGVRSDDEDYVPPLSYTENRSLEYFRKTNLWLVPSCRSCIKLLKESHEPKLVDRRDIVAGLISNNYKRMKLRGYKISEHEVQYSYTQRDQLCLKLFKRWEFATLTNNEPSIEEDEPEEHYERKSFSKRLDKPEIPYFSWLLSWGINEQSAEALDKAMELNEALPLTLLSQKELKFLEVAEALKPLIGPVGFAGSPKKYTQKVRKVLSKMQHPAADFFDLDLLGLSSPFEKIEKLKLLLKKEKPKF